MCTKKIQSHLKMENIFLQHQGKQILQLVLLHLSKILFCQFFGSFLYLTQKPYFLILSLKEFLKYQCFSLQREVTFVHNFVNNRSVLYLCLPINIVLFVLQEKGRWFDVVFPGGHVEGWQFDLALGVILQKDTDHTFMSLL